MTERLNLCLIRQVVGEEPSPILYASGRFHECFEPSSPFPLPEDGISVKAYDGAHGDSYIASSLNELGVVFEHCITQIRSMELLERFDCLLEGLQLDTRFTPAFPSTSTPISIILSYWCFYRAQERSLSKIHRGVKSSSEYHVKVDPRSVEYHGSIEENTSKLSMGKGSDSKTSSSHFASMPGLDFERDHKGTVNIHITYHLRIFDLPSW